jgi:transposase InsO family protein
MTTTAESIAAAIVEERPQEAAAAADLALDMASAAEIRGIPLHAALAYIHDRPRQEFSAPAFLRWCERYRIVSVNELVPPAAAPVATHEKESSHP